MTRAPHWAGEVEVARERAAEEREAFWQAWEDHDLREPDRVESEGSEA